MRPVFIFFLIALFSTALKSQVALQITQTGVQNFPAFAEEGEVDSISFYVQNTGNVAFVGDLVTHHRVNGNPLSDIDTLTISTLAPGDSVLVPIEDYELDPGEFDLGRNTIVIWVTDDNFSVTSNEDTNTVFIFNGPAFRFGPSGIVGFPLNPDTGLVYNFDIHVLNQSEDDFTGPLQTRFAVNGDTQTIVSNALSIPGLSSIFLPVTYTFKVPPYALQNNRLKLWVESSDTASAIDTAYYLIDFAFLNTGDKALFQGVSVAPHPVKEELRLDLPTELRIERVEIFDLQGREKQAWKSLPTGDARFPLAELAPGLYLLRLTTQKGQQWQRRIWKQ